MKKQIFLVNFLALTFVVMVCIFWSTRKPTTTERVPSQGSLILKRSEGWGECSEPFKCTLDTYLYDTGKVYFLGDINKEAQLSNEEMNTIIKDIKQSGIFEKDCTGPIIMDYIVEYEIRLDGKSRHLGVNDTGCENEMDEITRIIDALHKR